MWDMSVCLSVCMSVRLCVNVPVCMLVSVCPFAGLSTRLLFCLDLTVVMTGLVSGETFGARHSLILWAFFGFANLFILRVDMSIALVAMAAQNSSTSSANTSSHPLDSNASDCQYTDKNTKASHVEVKV